MVTFLIGFLIVMAALYLVAMFAIAWFSLYPIRIQQFLSPGYMGFRQEPFRTRSADGISLDGWIAGTGEDLVLICAHGYLVNRCEWVADSQALIPFGATMIFFDFRGHGQSGPGKVTFGIKEALDVEAVIAEARRLRARAKVVVLGSSMGAVASIIAASRRTVDGLVLDSPYLNLSEASDNWWTFLVGRKLAPFLLPASRLGKFLIGIDLKASDVSEYARSIGAPVLLFCGTHDPIVPTRSAEALASAFPRSRLVWFQDSTHGAGRFHHSEMYRAEVLRFLREITKVADESSGAFSPVDTSNA